MAGPFRPMRCTPRPPRRDRGHGPAPHGGRQLNPCKRMASESAKVRKQSVYSGLVSSRRCRWIGVDAKGKDEFCSAETGGEYLPQSSRSLRGRKGVDGPFRAEFWTVSRHPLNKCRGDDSLLAFVEFCKSPMKAEVSSFQKPTLSVLSHLFSAGGWKLGWFRPTFGSPQKAHPKLLTKDCSGAFRRVLIMVAVIFLPINQ